MEIEVPIPERKKKTKKKEGEGDLVLSQPLEKGDDFESKLQQFESEGLDDIKKLSEKQLFDVDEPKKLEKDKDPVYDFIQKVIDGHVPEDILKTLSKGSCNHCYGRGYSGFQKKPDRDIPVVCNCVAKKIKKGGEVVEGILKSLEEPKVDVPTRDSSMERKQIG